ncbi:MAG: rhomboid family intramembrane serine protease [Thiotrichaceae bacterium]|nr:rhomboid family intramembrane serine protease [Thiotrichaceae bacterium]
MEQYSKPILILIAINVLMFIISANDDYGTTNSLSLYFFKNEHFGIWQFATHMFMHGSFMHLFMNMFGLFMFGTSLQQAFGTRRFLTFYFISGFGAALIYLLINYYQFQSLYQLLIDGGMQAHDITQMLLSSQYPPNLLSKEQGIKILEIYHTPMVGASGALYGLLVAIAMIFPNTKIMLIFLPVPIAAKYFIPALITLDLVLALSGYSLFGANVAHIAHIGGAITGLILILYWRSKMNSYKN